MIFCNIDIEIRLTIYSEILVSSWPIDFIADYGPPSPPLFDEGMGSVQLFSVLAE